MKKFSFILAVALLAWWQPQAAAQTRPSVETIPCPSEPQENRPVLKRRAPEPDSQTTPQAEPNASTPPCNTILNTASDQATSEIRIDGLISVSESDVRKRMREHRLIPKSVTDADAVAKSENGIRQILFEYGYRHAQVSSRIEQHDQESPVLVFLISEGPRFRISEVKFEGNRVFSSPVLTSKFSHCLEQFDEDSPYRVDSYTVEYCLHTLANFERSQGYLQAKFGEPKLQEVGQALIVTINSDEGILYRIGNLEIEGADHVHEKTVREMLDMQRGEIASGEKIARTMYEDLKAVYGDRGFIQYTAEIEPTFHSGPRATEGVVDLKITIDEGQRFKVRKIFFKGDKLPETDLRQLLLLRAGEVYSQKSFEESIRRINETGWFNRVDKDRDVDFRTNEEEDLVDVVIKLTRRQDMSRSDQ
jgi:outer membrane protein insertion porin family